MVKYIFVLFIILSIVFIRISEKEFFKSVLHTVTFIFGLWINIPCFIDFSHLEVSDNNLMYLSVKLCNKYGIIYILLANIVLCIVLNCQAKFLNRNLYTKREIKRRYDNFVNDANELYIIGKDINFLNNDAYKVQINRIVHLGKNSRLLCQATNDKELKKLYKEFCEKGVGIKFYMEKDNITNLKGQIKIDQKGYKEAIFVCRKNKKYEMIKIDNQFLIDAILEKYKDIYINASAP